MVGQLASKPLIGILKNDVANKRGALAVIYPDLESMGQHAANMVNMLFQGKTIKEIYPRWTDFGIVIDQEKAKQFNIAVPTSLQNNDIIK